MPAADHAPAYAVLLAAHVVSAIVGFGGVALSGVYGYTGRNVAGPEALAELRRYFSGGRWASQLLWLVPFLGGAALVVDRGATALGEAWVYGAVSCWGVAMVVAVTFVWPAERVIRALLADGGPFAGHDGDGGGPSRPGGPDDRMATEAAESAVNTLRVACGRLGAAAAVCDVCFVVALSLMIIRPGS